MSKRQIKLSGKNKNPDTLSGFFGAGTGTRTLVSILARSCSTPEPCPQWKQVYIKCTHFQCAPGRTRTYNPLFRRQVLYPLSHGCMYLQRYHFCILNKSLIGINHFAKHCHPTWSFDSYTPFVCRIFFVNSMPVWSITCLLELVH